MQLDADRSGALSYSELRLGLKKMSFSPTIELSEEEFDVITFNKMLCTDEQEVAVSPSRMSYLTETLNPKP